MFFLLFLIGSKLLYYVLLVSVIQKQISHDYAAVHGVTKSRTQLSDWTDWLTELTDASISPLLSLPPPHPITLNHHRVSGWAPCIIEHFSSAIYFILYTCQSYFLCLSNSLPPHCVHKPILYIYISIPSLQIGSSIPVF